MRVWCLGARVVGGNDGVITFDYQMISKHFAKCNFMK